MDSAYPAVVILKGAVEIRTPVCLPVGRKSALICGGELAVHADEAQFLEDTGETVVNGSATTGGPASTAGPTAEKGKQASPSCCLAKSLWSLPAAIPTSQNAVQTPTTGAPVIEMPKYTRWR